jgi:hypothetical protein
VRGRIRGFLLVEAATFTVASLAHAGVLVHGHEHAQARVAEGVIAVVLLAGVLASWMRPLWTRAAGLAAQGFALLGTLVGLFTIAVGVGPRTTPDVAFHAGVVAVLVWGLVTAARAPASTASSPLRY